MSELTAKFYSRYEISEPELVEMHTLFNRYYRNADFKTFRSDLDKKNGAIIIREKKTRRIVGFSTILEMKMRINGKRLIGIFSGDTIVEDTYWGKNPLNFEMVKYMTKQLILHPFTPIYWFLISKGYKTYLLLANNFVNYYPHFKRENKQLADIATAYSSYLFGDYFDPKKKILDFGKEYQSLKGGVAEITADMCQRFPKIAFFNERNPTWDRGTELPCVGAITWTAFLHRVFVKPVADGLGSLFSFRSDRAPQRLSQPRKAAL
jgi:hypothetical protein